MGKVSLPVAARRLNVSEDTVRRRIHKGELAASQEATAQGFKWSVELADDVPAITTAATQSAPALGDVAAAGATVPRPDSRVVNPEDAIADTTAALRDLVQVIKAQLEMKDKQIGELHILLQQAQKALPVPKRPGDPWWRRWWRAW